jgi:ribosomal protein S18 acetylase RimI-like enzyme
LSLQERIELAEDFYTRRGLRPRFQLCPASLPHELDSALAERGYKRVSDTSVHVAPVERVAQIHWEPVKRHGLAVTVGEIDDAWMDTYAQAGNMGAHERAMRRGIVERIGPRAGLALARLDDQPVAVGMGVTERGWTGIFCMDTLPAFRRQGAATAILLELARWGQSQGATQVYLQVMTNNAPALALYARAGFTPLYTYHYREEVR